MISKPSRLIANSNDMLYKEKVISEFEQQTSKNALLEAEAILAQADAQKSNAENDLSYTVIKSPVNAVGFGLFCFGRINPIYKCLFLTITIIFKLAVPFIQYSYLLINIYSI